MGCANLVIEDHVYEIRKFWIGNQYSGGGSSGVANSDYHFVVSGTDDPFLFGWCATGAVKPAAKLVMGSDDNNYDTDLDQVTCVSYSQGHDSQDPDSPSIISFALSAEDAKTVVTY